MSGTKHLPMLSFRLCLTSLETLYMPGPGLFTVAAAPVARLLGPCPQDAYVLAALSPVCGDDLTGVSCSKVTFSHW